LRDPAPCKGSRVAVVISLLGGTHRGGVMVAFADGSLRFLAETISPETLEALTTAAGGERTGSGEPALLVEVDVAQSGRLGRRLTTLR
ncbi:H-X9-DG-CTERM domain-containing protein, partial [Singulisphaera rosea]